MIKVICTTSNAYKHIVSIFIFLFQKYWGKEQEATIVGYEHPGCELPDNFTFYSMGEQTESKQDFSNDLRKYFEQQSDHIIWVMEDTFLKEPLKEDTLLMLIELMQTDKTIGRISLTPDSIIQYTETYGVLNNGALAYQTPPDSDYRLSTQPAIWNKKYLLKWLLPNHSPWEMENLKGTLMQRPDTEFKNIALDKFDCPVQHNEGVRKRDLYSYDFTGIDEKIIEEMKQLNII